MKKGIALFLGLLAFGGILFAEGTPATAKGTWDVFVETAGVDVDQLGVEYFLVDKLAVGSGLFFSWTDENSPQTDTRLIVAPHVKYHFFQKGGLSFYVGGFVSYDHLCSLDATIDWRRVARVLQVGPLAGFDWFFVPNVSLGARYRVFYELDAVSVRTGGTTTTTTDNFIYASPYPELLLTIYFTK